MQGERLLSIILLLQTRKIVTSKELAEKLEVSERTVFRDIDALSLSGIPIYTVRGSYGGFSLDKNFRVDLTGLSYSELKELFINRIPGPLTDLGLGSKFDQVINKLTMALPAEHRDEAHQLSKRIFIDPVQWFPHEESVPHLKTIEKALKGNLFIYMDYRKGNREPTSRLVAPYGLVAKTNIWYLVAKREKMMRVYRVSRIQDLNLLDKTFQFPKGFDLAAFWTNWCREFENGRPRYDVILYVDPRFVSKVAAVLDTGQIKKQGQLNQNGRAIMSIEFETLEDAHEHILSFGSAVEVAKPIELRDKLSESIKRLNSLYQI